MVSAVVLNLLVGVCSPRANRIDKIARAQHPTNPRNLNHRDEE